MSRRQNPSPISATHSLTSEGPKPSAIDEAAWTGKEHIYVASQWQLMWWRFRRHRMANVGAVFVILFYAVALAVEPIAPYHPDLVDANYSYRPPTTIHFVDAEGRFHLRPFIYGTERERDPRTLSLVFSENTAEVYPIYLLAQGTPYKLWGLIRSDLHIFGLRTEDEKVFLLGADGQGRDVLSRLVYGTRISMSVGLVGVIISAALGLSLGGLSGYFGGTADLVIQRLVEFLRSIPTVPLWMSLSAALPVNWPITRIYFGITIILSLIGWTGLARVVRGRFLSLREEEFVLAARLSGASTMRIILYHMVPSMASHIIAALTLAIPRMILSETSLSFLGLGLRYPAISWGVLLQDAQNVRSVALAPWLLSPGVAVVIAVLSLNFLGDGLRDAADPYGR